jgi:uncharacterized membrane protein YsdA (DUF1294 family)/cold shock CspA family protein
VGAKTTSASEFSPVVFRLCPETKANDGIAIIVRHKGKITNWNAERGFGFITPAGGGERVFLHITAISDRRRPPADGDMVTYDLALDGKKRPRAASVRRSAAIRPKTQAKSASTSSSFPLVAVSLFVLFVIAGTLVGPLPRAVIAIYGVLSILTFVVYWFDKSAARHGRWRTEESLLLFLGLVGGWPGAVVAQRVLRHKSRKRSFQVAFWGTVVMNSVVLGWLFTDIGSKFFDPILK